MRRRASTSCTGISMSEGGKPDDAWGNKAVFDQKWSKTVFSFLIKKYVDSVLSHIVHYIQLQNKDEQE